MEEKEYQELIVPYRECLKNMANRLDNLAGDYLERYGEEPIHHIQKRIKTKSSIEGKLKKKDCEDTAEEARYHLRDIAGIRVICYEMRGIEMLAEALKRQNDLEIVKEKDYISHPKSNGYRSYHLVIGVPIYLVDRKEYYPVEIQFRTMAMDLWASLEHRSCYKKDERERREWSDRFLQYAFFLEEMERSIEQYEEKREERERKEG